MLTRWRSPPLSWCRKRDTISAGKLTASSNAPMRACRSVSRGALRRSSERPIVAPTRRRGLSEEAGSEEMIWTSPLKRRRPTPRAVVMSSPSKLMRLRCVDKPCQAAPRSTSAPLSPTRPSTSPSRISIEIIETATTFAALDTQICSARPDPLPEPVCLTQVVGGQNRSPRRPPPKLLSPT